MNIMKENLELLLKELDNDLNADDFYSITIRRTGIVMQGYYTLILAKKIKEMGIISISESGFIECEVKDSPITIVLTND